ncbi:hypothetical protein [Arthrobacter sp. 754]|uniref:hypothetical protein n=1 Tax=Arthrobacter sp. 754 TaxID=3156315 RepID=UPI003395A32E
MEAYPNGLQRPPKRRLRKWLKGVLLALLVLAAPVLALELSHVIGTAKMVAFADRLQPPPAWKEDAHNVTGGLFCTAVVEPCDSMWRSYRTQQPVVRNDIQRISDGAGLGVRVEGDCETSPLPPNVTAMYVACSAKGVRDGYDVEIRVLKLTDDDPERIIQFRLSSIKNR